MWPFSTFVRHDSIHRDIVPSLLYDVYGGWMSGKPESVIHVRTFAGGNAKSKNKPAEAVRKTASAD